MCKHTIHESFLNCYTLILHTFLLFDYTYWIPMSNSEHPCNFEKFCIGNFTCSNCFNKVVIFRKPHPCTLWDDPTPQARMLMMPNNMSEVKQKNKGCYTSCICYAWLWNSFHWDSTFFFIRSKAFFSFLFCLACGLFKIQTFVEVWSCCPKPSRWIYGYPNLHSCIWRPYVWSKCLRNNHLAA